MKLESVKLSSVESASGGMHRYPCKHNQKTCDERHGESSVRENVMHDFAGEMSSVSRRLWLRGFSLIELLVVISIIMILISILMPAMSKAKQTARGISCMNNLRQIGICTNDYSNDYSNYAPYGVFGSNYLWLYPSFQGNVFPDYITNGGKSKLIKDPLFNYYIPTIALCPSGKRFDGINPYPVPDFSYGFNASVCRSYGAAAPQSRLSNIMTPSKKFMLTDITNGSGATGIAAQISFSLRHRNGSNVLFVDNHAELWKWVRIPFNYTIDTVFY